MTDLSTEERQRIYQEELVRAEAQQAVKAQLRRKRIKGFAILVLCLVALIVGIVIFRVWDLERTVGAEGFLHSEGFDGVLMYDSPDSYHLAKKYGLKKLTSDNVSYIRNRVRVRIIGTHGILYRIIGTDGTLYEVQIMAVDITDAPTGKTGWVEPNDVNIVTK